jgi:hypothetical protein
LRARDELSLKFDAHVLTEASEPARNCWSAASASLHVGGTLLTRESGPDHELHHASQFLLKSELYSQIIKDIVIRNYVQGFQSKPQRFCTPRFPPSEFSELRHRISCSLNIFFTSSSPFDSSTRCHWPLRATFSEIQSTMKHIGARYADKKGCTWNCFHRLAPFATMRMKRHAASDAYAVMGWP